MVTLNNYTPEQLEAYRRIVDQLADGPVVSTVGRPPIAVTWFGFQPEVGEQNGTPHLQSYCTLSKKTTKNTAIRVINDLLPGRPNVLLRRGTHQEAKDYVSKEETRAEGAMFLCGGEEPAPGTRSDLVCVKARIDAGAKEAEIADEFFGQWVRYHKAFVRYRGIKLPNRNSPTFTQVYWGPLRS